MIEYIKMHNCEYCANADAVTKCKKKYCNGITVQTKFRLQKSMSCASLVNLTISKLFKSMLLACMHMADE